MHVRARARVVILARRSKLGYRSLMLTGSMVGGLGVFGHDEVVGFAGEEEQGGRAGFKARKVHDKASTLCWVADGNEVGRATLDARHLCPLRRSRCWGECGRRAIVLFVGGGAEKGRQAVVVLGCRRFLNCYVNSALAPSTPRVLP